MTKVLGLMLRRFQLGALLMIVLVAATALGASSSAQAQSGTEEDTAALTSFGVGFDMAVFEADAARAEAAIEAAQASTSALEVLRAQFATYREKSTEAEQRAYNKVVAIEAQLKALGPAPAEGVAELAETAERRASLKQQIAEAEAPMFAASAAFIRAQNIIFDIDELITQRDREAFIHRETSPLSPALWAKGWGELQVFWGGVLREVHNSLESEIQRERLISQLPFLLLLGALSIALITRARRIIYWSQNELMTRQRRGFGLLSAALSAAELLLPILGVLLFARMLMLSNVMALRGDLLIGALPFAGALFFTSLWVLRSLEARGRSILVVGRPLDHRASIALAIALSCWSVTVKMTALHDFGAAGLSLIALPLTALAAWGLWQLARVFGASSPKEDQNQDETSAPVLRQLLRIMRLSARAAALLGLLLFSAGYLNAGTTLVFSTSYSLLLIIGFFRLHGLLCTLLTRKRAPGPAGEEMQETEETRSNGLIAALLGICLTLLAVPVLALIWGVRETVLREILAQLISGFKIGNTTISIVDFFSFVLIFIIGYSLTRFAKSALSTSVLPNTKLDKGAQNAIVTGVGYIGIFLAALAAISATGLDLSSLAIVAGALSVGIGFGLQNIVSNFVSGIILLIERPIKEGDWIDVGGFSGYVRKISVRSTAIDTFDRATVIIPNADLVAGTVTNWTHGSMVGRVKVPVGVAYGSDPERVSEILLKIARAHPMVLMNPEPQVIFLAFGADSMDFEIRALLRDVNWVTAVRSEMNHQIVQAFDEAGIEIPFAQRDITLRNVDELASSVAKMLQSGQKAAASGAAQEAE